MYNKKMKLEDLKNKKIMLFGKSRSFSLDELKMQLKSHGAILVQEYEEDVECVVDGAMMTPVESLKSDEIYEKKEAEFIKVEILEELLSSAIDEDVLMMSLKLSSDKQRLINFLTNENINDQFYFKLLGIYNWGNDDFYENDDNRDVTASIIRRFYKNIDRNHNIEFSKLGLMHLVEQSSDPKLLEVIATLKPLRKSFKVQKSDHGFKIIISLAKNTFTPKSVLKELIKESNVFIKVLISKRKNLDTQLQKLLFDEGSEEVLSSLASCENLSDELFQSLSTKEFYVKKMASSVKLDKEKYMFFKERVPSKLATNETLSVEMQKDLLASHLEDVKESLAANKNISYETILELLKLEDKRVDFFIYSNQSTPQDVLKMGFDNIDNYDALAHNENTPVDLLEKIYKSSSTNTCIALAKNSSTPVEILYQLQLDSKYERYVKENPSFGKHIQQENIGWQV